MLLSKGGGLGFSSHRGNHPMVPLDGASATKMGPSGAGLGVFQGLTRLRRVTHPPLEASCSEGFKPPSGQAVGWL
ncbi:hypothetical protein ACJZ2D_016967 [Fusarium nematophilum]